MKKTLIMAVSLLLIFSISAMAIIVEPEQKRDRDRIQCSQIKGEITDINAADMQLVVNDVTVQVNADTVITKDDVVIPFEDLEVGLTVCVCGEYDGDILVAKKVKVVVCTGCGDVNGEITSIDATELQLVVDGVTIQVTTDTKIHKKWQILAFEDLEVGMMVCVYGEYDGDVLVAENIAIQGCGGGGGGGGHGGGC